MTLLHGDCLKVLPTLEADSVDALVTDPPAGIGFMGKEWDGSRGGYAQWVEWLAKVLRQARRVLKPGGWALVWALPRTSHWTGAALEGAGFEVRDVISHLFGTGFPKSQSCLKPAAEFWWLARKPGPLLPLNIDGCRVDGKPRTTHAAGNIRGTEAFGGGQPVGVLKPGASGRWPPNVVLDETAAELVDAQSGVLTSGAPGTRRKPHAASNIGAGLAPLGRPESGFGDSGGASRFYYVAKASRRERGEGNTHPCVKPIALMRWLCRLVTPPGGTVLDPFAGSGTTLLAARAEGLRFIGIEESAEYVEIARRRLAEAETQGEIPLAPEAAP